MYSPDMGDRPVASAVPPFVALAAHPIRWRLLAELARSDRQVLELAELVAQPQGLVSYHLGRLRAGGVVSARRSSFDGRASYYRAELDRCGDLLADAGGALHPGLRRARRAAPPLPRRRGRPVRVLFACTGNGSRSQLAESLLRAQAGEAVMVVSGGSHPKPIHPNTLAVLAERGIDASGLRSKSLAEFGGRSFDHVVTLCDRVREVCPEFPGSGTRVHWSIEDPSRIVGPPRQTLAAFRALADDLEARITFLCALIAHDPKETSNHGR
jgi:protein-tyrosine-phosphatase